MTAMMVQIDPGIRASVQPGLAPALNSKASWMTVGWIQQSMQEHFSRDDAPANEHTPLSIRRP
jgi:hypothetical protein